MDTCVYRGNETKREHDGYPVYPCPIYNHCIEGPRNNKVASCIDCTDRLLESDPDFKDKWADQLVIYDRRRKTTTALRDLLARGSAFLLGGGPSATEEKMQALSERGHFSLAVNNKAGHSAYRPQAFVFSDPPSKFSHSIWLDPAIMKFCPLPKLRGWRGAIRRKDPVTKKFVDCGGTWECPNVWGFDRRSWFSPDESFFKERDAAWGNHKAGVERTGITDKVVCTMLLGLRLLHYLGARKIYLVGVDFNMTPGKEYSFNQSKNTPGASNSNNRQFRVVNGWLHTMKNDGVFEKYGLEVYNCNPDSGLTAFPFVDFEQALEESRGYVEKVPDLSHWYEKIDEKKMDKISDLIVAGKTPKEIRDIVNQGINKEKNHLDEEMVNVYLKVLYQRTVQ